MGYVHEIFMRYNGMSMGISSVSSNMAANFLNASDAGAAMHQNLQLFHPSLMSNPDKKNHRLLTFGGYFPISHHLIVKWYPQRVPPQLKSRLGFINPDLIFFFTSQRPTKAKCSSPARHLSQPAAPRFLQALKMTQGRPPKDHALL